MKMKGGGAEVRKTRVTLSCPLPHSCGSSSVIKVKKLCKRKWRASDSWAVNVILFCDQLPISDDKADDSSLFVTLAKPVR